ncbi:MAG TPA: hypothetical protein VNA13_03435 [Xanthomonadales bacterium]|nr:hypothetical protein [Xanthomonadales bacterium]
MTGILNIYKPLGLTPVQLINKLRKERSELNNLKIGFAGRLDPLAHGVILMMIGEETKNRDKYLGLDKEYEFEVLFGVTTDTYDALGLITSSSSEQSESRSNKIIQQFNNSTASRQAPTNRDPDQIGARTMNFEGQIKNFIKSKIGKQIQLYPPYSSKEINGKPLYQWARENKLSEIQIPEKEIVIYSIELISIQSKSADFIKNKITKNINRVDGDFRQEEILNKWESFFSFYSSSGALVESRSNSSPQGRTLNIKNTFSVAKFKINCSSGTYIRSLANNLGEISGSGAIALSILRTRVGENVLEDSIRL